MVSVPTSSTWLQLVQGLLLPYCLLFIAFKQMSIISEYKTKIETTRMKIEQRPKLQILCCLGLAANTKEFVVLGNGSVNILKNLQLSVGFGGRKLRSSWIHWKTKEQRFSSPLHIFNALNQPGPCHFRGWCFVPKMTKVEQRMMVILLTDVETAIFFLFRSSQNIHACTSQLITDPPEHALPWTYMHM